MKNIHLIPTDKPSRLYKDDSQVLNLNIHSLIKGIFTNGVGSNQHIYITSNEKIKNDDWVYCPVLKKPIPICFDSILMFKNMGFDSSGNSLYKKEWLKKIILTTDPELIKNGVQAINDAFLEWFVKNPSCEWVEVEKTFVTNSGLGYQEYAILDSDFKVLEVVANRPQSSYKIGEVTELDGYEYITEYKIIIPQEYPKQETIEEAAEKNYENKTAQIPVPTTYWVDSKKLQIQNFIEGANWQAKRMYSEEEVLEILREFFKVSSLKNFPFVTTIPLWFKQFKKK
jgi:hypothetical protein